jgi:shikimate dehydrogenase
MKTFGLIGYPLSHSFSPGYFAHKFETQNITDAEYLSFPISSINKLTELVANNKSLVGLNVTIPYKQAVIPFLDELDETAVAVGAVNTIKIKNNKLIGYNTDVIGFEKSLSRLLENDSHAIILGTGGAAKAVGFVLKKLNIEHIYVSRNKSKHTFTYEELDETIIKKHTLIINTTPIGMSPEVSSSPNIPYNLLSEQHFLFDLIYNPEITLFLQKGKDKGCRTQNGLEMLHLQADSSWSIWNSK